MVNRTAGVERLLAEGGDLISVDRSDEELVRLAQQGALAAFEALVERYLPKVIHRLRVVLPPEEVEDVAQEVFIAVIRSLPGFRFEARFSTWLRTLVNRQVANYYRSRPSPTLPLTAFTPGGQPDSDPDPEVMLGLDRNSLNAHLMEESDLDDQITLRLAFRNLPAHYQEILFLRFTEGLQFDEIAQIQGQSLEATKSLFRRAVAALQRQVTHA